MPQKEVGREDGMVWEGGRDRIPSRIGYQGLLIIYDKTIISRYVEYILHACTYVEREESGAVSSF